MRPVTAEQKKRAAEKKRAYRAANRDRVRAIKRDWLKANPEQAERARQRSRKWRELNPEREKENQLKRYGLTRAAYDAMSAAQDGLCALCHGTNPTTKTPRLFVDHDHVTGRVRALLCNNSNFGLGHFKDDPGLLLKAVAYIRRHKT